MNNSTRPGSPFITAPVVHTTLSPPSEYDRPDRYSVPYDISLSSYQLRYRTTSEMEDLTMPTLVRQEAVGINPDDIQDTNEYPKKSYNDGFPLWVSILTEIRDHYAGTNRPVVNYHTPDAAAIRAIVTQMVKAISVLDGKPAYKTLHTQMSRVIQALDIYSSYEYNGGYNLRYVTLDGIIRSLLSIE